MADAVQQNLLPRAFEACRSALPDGECPKIVVMQFNVLADGLAHSQFPALPTNVLDHPGRLEMALAEVRFVEPDILCVAEVNHWEDFWRPRLRDMGYEGLYVPKYNPAYPEGFQREPAKYLGRPSDGCALFVRSSKLRFGREKRARFGDLTEHKDCNQVVVAAEVLDAATGQHLLTASNSHLQPGTGASDAGLRKAQGTAWARLLGDFPGPFVVCADMNEDMAAAPEGAVRTLCDSLRLESAYAKGQGSDPAYSAFHGEWHGPKFVLSRRELLDYILISDVFTPCRLLEVPMLPDGKMPEGELPCAEYPSDHLSIAVEIAITGGPAQLANL